MSIGGFIVMLASSIWVVTSYRRKMGIATGRTTAGRDKRGRDPKQPKRPRLGLSDRLEERWRRRQGGS